MRREIGSIRKLGKDYYEVAVTVGKNAKTGAQKRKYKNVRGSRRKAEATLQMLARKYDPDVVLDVTVAEYIELNYMTHLAQELKEGHIKQRTYESYEERLRLHVIPYIGDIPISEIKPSHVRICQEAGKTEAVKREARKAMSCLFREAVYDELLEYNPVQSVRPPKKSTYEPEVLDIEDIEVYLWHFRDTRAEALVLLALGGAYRRGELDALNVEDINLETGQVWIDDAYVESKGGTIHESPKNRKERSNRLPLFVLERLREILPASGAVVQTLKGERMKPASIAQLYERIRDKLPEGVPRISLKNLRHTGLTAAFDATGNIDRVAGHGGHSKEVSKRHYIREHDDQEITLADDLDRYFREAFGKAKKHGSQDLSGK